ncbi:hypothetical protein ACROYT_G013893 [Oculina patagonica]
MPAHVVNLYFSQSEDSIVNRMKNIIRNAVRQTQPPAEQPLKDLDVVEVLVSKHTKYAKPMTPAERKSEAVKAKMSNQFVDSSPNSSETEEEGNKRKKRKLDCAKEAQNARTKMCEKALQYMDNVNNLLQKCQLRQLFTTMVKRNQQKDGASSLGSPCRNLSTIIKRLEKGYGVKNKTSALGIRKFNIQLSVKDFTPKLPEWLKGRIFAIDCQEQWENCLPKVLGLQQELIAATSRHQDNLSRKNRSSFVGRNMDWVPTLNLSYGKSATRREQTQTQEVRAKRSKERRKRGEQEQERLLKLQKFNKPGVPLANFASEIVEAESLNFSEAEQVKEEARDLQPDEQETHDCFAQTEAFDHLYRSVASLSVND